MHCLLVGRTASDVIYNLLSLSIMALTGLLVGWRIHSGPFEAIFGFALLLAFAYAFSWVMAYVGLLVPSVEVINNASFIVIFPAMLEEFDWSRDFSQESRSAARRSQAIREYLTAHDRFGKITPEMIQRVQSGEGDAVHHRGQRWVEPGCCVLDVRRIGRERPGDQRGGAFPRACADLLLPQWWQRGVPDRFCRCDEA